MAKDWRSSAVDVKKEGPTTDPVEQARRRAKRARQIFYVLFAIGALLGGVAATVYLLGGYEQPYFLTVPVIEYKNPLWPVNPLAEQDGDALQVFFPSHDKRSVAIESQSRRALVEQLNGLKTEKHHTTIVFHLCALARFVTDKDGKNGTVYIIPADAGPDDRPIADFMIPLDDVIDAMRACPAKNKLLILDLARPTADPRVGVLTNDVEDHVHARLKEIEKAPGLPFPVLCPCGPGQRSLIREDYRVSAFAFFLAEGCRGKADGQNPEKRTNGRVSLQELYEYARQEVDQWASRYRNQKQTPTIYGTATDFDLVILDRAKGAIAEPPAPEPIPYPAWLKEGWNLRDSWYQPDPNDLGSIRAGAFREAPRAFSRLEAALIRAEKRWRGGLGGDEKRARSELDVVPELQREVQDLRSAKRPQPRSLAQEIARGAVPNKEILAILQADLLKPDESKPPPKDPDDTKDPKDPKEPKPPAPAPPKEGEKKKTPPELAKALDGKIKGKGKASDFDVASAVITLVRTATKDDLDADKLAALNILLSSSNRKLTSRYAETLCFSRLIELQGRLKDAGKTLDLERIQQVLRLTDDCESALASDPRILFWFKNKLQELCDRRYAAEAKIFQDKSPAISEEGLLDFEAVGKDFQSVIDDVQVVQGAFLLDDEMMVRLPGYVTYLAEHPTGGDPKDCERWLQAVSLLERLHDLLQPSSEGTVAPPPIPDINAVSRDLERVRNALKQPFNRRPEIELAMERGNPVEYLELLSLFESPRIYAAGREGLWGLSQQFATKVRPRALEPLPDEFERAATRAKLSIALLHLGGFAGADALKLEEDRVMSGGRRENIAWAPLAEKLRVAWSEELPAQLMKTTDLVAADRLLRALPPYDRSPASLRNPGAQMRHDRAQEFAKFLAALYQKQLNQLSQSQPGSAAEAYFQYSASTYSNYAP